MKNLKHYIKINLPIKGYCLFVKNKDQFEENDLNVHNENVPINYILIQKHIEKILFSNSLPVSLSFNFDIASNKLIVGFGLLLNIEDDKGREGIVYIHAIEVNDNNQLFSIILHYIKVLSPESIKEFYLKVLNDVINGRNDVLFTLEMLCNKLEEYEFSQLDEIDISNSRFEFNKIIHNSVGGAALAWLTFAKLLNNKNSKWEVYDDSELNGKIITQLLPKTNDKTIFTSELFNLDYRNLSNVEKVEKKIEDGKENSIVEDTVEKHEIKETKDYKYKDIETKEKLPINEQLHLKQSKFEIHKKNDISTEEESTSKKIFSRRATIIKNIFLYSFLIILIVLHIINSSSINSLKTDIVKMRGLIIQYKKQNEILLQNLNDSNPKKTDESTIVNNELFDNNKYSILENFFPTGFIGDIENIKFQNNYKDITRPDSFCVRISYSTDLNGWGGIYWQYPANNWCKQKGKDLSKSSYKRITFFTKGEKGGEEVKFKSGQDCGDSFVSDAQIVKLSKSWTKVTIDIEDKDLSNITGAFCCIIDSNVNKNRMIAFYIDDVQFER